MYLGVLFVQKNKNSSIKTVVFVLVFIATAVMAAWIWWKMRAIKKVLLEEQAERRAVKLKQEESESSDQEWNAVAGSSIDRPSSREGLVARDSEYPGGDGYARPAEFPSESQQSMHPGYPSSSHPGYPTESHPGYPRESLYPAQAELSGAPGRAYQ